MFKIALTTPGSEVRNEMDADEIEVGPRVT